MSVTEEIYNALPPVGKSQCLVSLHANYGYTRPVTHLGSKYPPLLELEPSQYVLDELHLLLRITYILVRNIIPYADHLDQTGELRGGRGSHIPQLEEVIKSCGVPFRINRVTIITQRISVYK